MTDWKKRVRVSRILHRPAEDRSTFYKDLLRDRWVYSIKARVASRSVSPRWGVNSISFGSPHVRPMGVHCTCGGLDEIKKIPTHPKNITALFGGQATGPSTSRGRTRRYWQSSKGGGAVGPAATWSMWAGDNALGSARGERYSKPPWGRFLDSVNPSTRTPHRVDRTRASVDRIELTHGALNSAGPYVQMGRWVDGVELAVAHGVLNGAGQATVPVQWMGADELDQPLESCSTDGIDHPELYVPQGEKASHPCPPPQGDRSPPRRLSLYALDNTARV